MHSIEADPAPDFPSSEAWEDTFSALCIVAILLSIAKALLMARVYSSPKDGIPGVARLVGIHDPTNGHA